MVTEKPHAAFARALDQLDVVVVDDSKPMQSILRSMLNSFKVTRVRTFDGPQIAMDSMLVDPPNLVIVDWLMEPIDGLAMLKALRSRRMGSLATVPAIILTSSPTRRLVEASLKVGSHAVLAKPLSPTTLQKRIDSIRSDARHFYLDEETDSWMLHGTEEIIAAQRSRERHYRLVREDYLEFAAKRTPPVEAKPVEPKRVEAKQVKPVQPAIAKVAISDKPRPKKAIGIGARRVDQTQPEQPTR